MADAALFDVDGTLIDTNYHRLLLEKVKQRGFTIVLASSAPQKHLEHYLDLLDAHDLIEHATTSDDVEQTKPERELRRRGRRALRDTRTRRPARSVRLRLALWPERWLRVHLDSI